jgi:hypothetical protein
MRRSASTASGGQRSSAPDKVVKMAHLFFNESYGGMSRLFHKRRGLYQRVAIQYCYAAVLT